MTLRNPCGDLVATPRPENPLRTPDNDPCGDLVLRYHAETQLGAAWLPDINAWCGQNLGRQAQHLQDPDGDWWTQLVDREWHQDRAGSLVIFVIAISTRHPEDHALVTLTWC